MSWRRLAPHLYSAAKLTATGATITLGSTVFSCYLAVKIEVASHRTLFKFFPHWYANVEYANGIDPDLLASVRASLAQQKQQQQQQSSLSSSLLTLTQEAKHEQEQDAPPPLVTEEDRTKTIFTMEGLVKPARQRVQEMSFANDLSACAMTA